MHWGGDPQTTWNGMAAALRGGLSASLSGVAFWSHDIGGFRGQPTDDLYVRWAQFGLLSSNSRCHGTTPREPWAFGEEALDIFRAYAEYRYQLIPYIYTYAEIAARTGLPAVRPLVLEYQDDPATHRLDTQYLLGEDILVAPVFESEGEQDVYLPEGTWTHRETGTRYDGKTTVSVHAPLDSLPVFYRGGSVIPLRDPTQTIQPGTPTSLTYRATLADGHASGQFYDIDEAAMLSVDIDAGTDVMNITLDEGSVDEIEVDVRGVAEHPEQVLVNGDQAASWQYDSTTDSLHVTV
jgi:alpha-D-xyloside xylohydrolase